MPDAMAIVTDVVVMEFCLNRLDGDDDKLGSSFTGNGLPPANTMHSSHRF